MKHIACPGVPCPDALYPGVPQRQLLPPLNMVALYTIREIKREQEIVYYFNLRHDSLFLRVPFSYSH